MDEEENKVIQLDKIAAALAHFQAEVPTVAKTKTAKLGTYSYTYAGLADVTEAAMPLLSKHGLAFITTPSNGVLTGMLIHTSGQSITGSLPITGGTPQAIGSSLTYMRRYLLGCMTGLVTDEDDDGQAAQAPSARRPAASAPPTRTMSRRRPPQTDGAAEPVPAGGSEVPEPPLPAAPSPVPGAGMSPSGTEPAITKLQLAKLHILLDEHGMSDRDVGLKFLSGQVGRTLTSSKELTRAEAGRLIDAESPVGPEPDFGEGS